MGGVVKSAAKAVGGVFKAVGLSPEINMPAPAAPPPPPTDNAEARAEMDRAAEEERRRRRSVGASLLTGGAGVTEAANVGRRTLTGD